MLAPTNRRRMPRRLTQLVAGLLLYGFSMALMVESTLGNMPWDVLHQGIAGRTGLAFGLVTVLVSVVVLLIWVPLRQRPGLGTLANVVVIGFAVELSLAVLPTPSDLALRLVYALTGVVLNGLATAAYIGVELGPGPRDGLMTGLVRRTGGSVRLIRTAIEVAVVLIGWLLGGTLGAITVVYALAIGPLTQAFLPRCTVRLT